MRDGESAVRELGYEVVADANDLNTGNGFSVSTVVCGGDAVLIRFIEVAKDHQPHYGPTQRCWPWISASRHRRREGKPAYPMRRPSGPRAP